MGAKSFQKMMVVQLDNFIQKKKKKKQKNLTLTYNKQRIINFIIDPNGN